MRVENELIRAEAMRTIERAMLQREVLAVQRDMLARQRANA
jgi:hypothetical protein